MEETLKKSLLDLYERTLEDNKEIYLALLKLCELLLAKEIITFKEMENILSVIQPKESGGKCIIN